MKEEEINNNIPKIINFFVDYIVKTNSHESYYLIERMIKKKLIDANIAKNIESKYFAHYRTEKENKSENFYEPFNSSFLKNYSDLSKNNWELHKKYIKEGVNPNEIAKIIRNDEIEKLQEISSENDFDFNQIIEPSLYERCSFINQKNVTLIDYAAFFSAIKCFKYLLLNNSKLTYTGKYAIAGENLEIIHLCVQNHASFNDAYETAIRFHKNDIFKYVYENKLEKLKQNTLINLGYFCIKYGNYEIFSYLVDEGMNVNDYIINETAKIGNTFLVKYFFVNDKIPKNILVFSIDSNNNELVEYILQNFIDVNANDVCLLCLIFILIICNLNNTFGNYLSNLKQHL